MKSNISPHHASLLISLLFSSLAAAQDTQLSPGSSELKPRLEILDTRHYPASNFLAYTEFELSGEPLAEALGLDLDLLDPDQVHQPTVFDYAAGIESYEYSEEAMYALNYQSGMGLSLASGPRNRARLAKQGYKSAQEALQARIAELAESVGYDLANLPANMALISLPYLSGSPEFAQAPASAGIKGERLEVFSANGDTRSIQTLQPGFQRDYASLAWDAKSFERVLNPAAIGGILLKEVMWAQDFLGGMHEQASDEEVEADSATMDQDGKFRLGVSIADGFNGVLLTEQSLDKLSLLQEALLFDGQALGVSVTPAYRASADSLIWLPHKIELTEQHATNLSGIESLKVSDARSTLRDSWQLLWPLAELYAMSDQRSRNENQNPAFQAVFDGQPFAAAPIVNTDTDARNDKPGSDAFSLANNLLNLSFENLQSLHFDEQYGTFVQSATVNKGKQGKASISRENIVSTFDAAYTLVALGIYQRALDALPVGYAAGDAGSSSLETAAGKRALSLIQRQADFILSHLFNEQGLVLSALNLEHLALTEERKASTEPVSLDAQFAVIRGLASAFVSTKDVRYRDAARRLYMAVELYLYDHALGTWASQPGQATEHTPYTAAAISGALRELILRLRNFEGERQTALELPLLIERYTSWFNTVINGGMQLSEALADTGEHFVEGETQARMRDSDGDGVPKTVYAGDAYGRAPVLAARIRISAQAQSNAQK